MESDSRKPDLITSVLTVIFCIVVFFVIWLMWARMGDHEHEEILNFYTEYPDISQVSMDNVTYWSFSYEVRNITGAGDETIRWTQTTINIKSENGSLMAFDLPLNEHDLNDYDRGEDGSVDIQCWYEDIGVQDGRLGEGDMILITGVPPGVDGVSFSMHFQGHFLDAFSGPSVLVIFC